MDLRSMFGHQWWLFHGLRKREDNQSTVCNREARMFQLAIQHLGKDSRLATPLGLSKVLSVWPGEQPDWSTRYTYF
jgi:hypothetical protein